MNLAQLPINTALVLLLDPNADLTSFRSPPDLSTATPDLSVSQYTASVASTEKLAAYLRQNSRQQLSRPMQRKLVTLINCQLLEEEGRSRATRAARSLGERSVTELILLHQNPQQLSAHLWSAVRNRGCQFLGPAMQEEVLKLVLLALEDGSALSRKVLVMFVVQRLEGHFPQASKTSIGHVVQLLYRASCFKVTKREGDSSLMQLKEEFRTYESLRREHDSQIVQIATEAGLRIAPDQVGCVWNTLHNDAELHIGRGGLSNCYLNISSGRPCSTATRCTSLTCKASSTSYRLRSLFCNPCRNSSSPSRGLEVIDLFLKGTTIFETLFETHIKR